MTDCPCVSGNSYDECCGPYIAGNAAAPTAEALMRSRFTAFASGRLDYIERTCASEMREKTYDRGGAERVAEMVKWLSLQVSGASCGSAMDDTGKVGFRRDIPRGGTDPGAPGKFRVSARRRRWVYVAGEIETGASVPDPIKVRRNDACPCGSGRKFKKCCGA